MESFLAHRGICISDLDAACEFYANALRFSPVEDGVADGRVLQALTGHGDAAVRSQLVQDEAGVTLDLVQFLSPPAVGTRHRRPLNQCGLTHLCFWTPCIEETARLIEEHGGIAHWHTLVTVSEMNTRVMYCSDPDGVRVELGEKSGASFAFLHAGVCVGDLEATLTFYREVLGFRALEQLELKQHAAWLAPLMELQDVSLTAHVLVSPRGERIELLECHRPQPFGSRRLAPPNQLGLSHMTFAVTDLNHTAGLIGTLGGTDATFICADGERALACADPNGVTLIMAERRP
jgi:catechol 2,3-dioxygenase-like lactoylglutathione lyase family enzyme